MRTRQNVVWYTGILSWGGFCPSLGQGEFRPTPAEDGGFVLGGGVMSGGSVLLSKQKGNSWTHWGLDRRGGWDMCCILVFWWEQCWRVDSCREEGKETEKCHWAGYWRHVTKAWIIHNSRSWHKSEQDGVSGKRKPACRADYSNNCAIVCFNDIPAHCCKDVNNVMTINLLRGLREPFYLAVSLNSEHIEPRLLRYVSF